MHIFGQRKHLKVFVGVPHRGEMVSPFVISFVNMLNYFNTHQVGSYKTQMMEFNFIRGSILPKQRRELVIEALEKDATHMLWLDSDHTFPRNIIHRMVHWSKDVLAVNCVTKVMPAQPTARYKPREGSDDPLHGTPCYTDTDSPELEKVWRVGTGIMLVDMNVYRRMDRRDVNHMFDMFFRDDVQNYQGEDWTMAEMFDKMGVDVWIDHPLSDQCGHVGYFNYTHDHVGSKEQITRLQQIIDKNPQVIADIQKRVKNG